MSYLDCPRIHFIGLFFTNPGNLNNKVANYDPTKPLNPNTGLYRNQEGKALFWLEKCKVTSVASPEGWIRTSPLDDALVGAAVKSLHPTNPPRDEDTTGMSLAKIVDLDPDMQFRTEVYGLRIYVEIDGDGGFYGDFGVSQARDLWFYRRGDGYPPLVGGVQVAVATWHQRLRVARWIEPTKRSPVFDALSKRAADGLDVRLTVDMYQTRLDKEFEKGNRFGFGRLSGVIGPADLGEPEQIVPGRRLYDARSFVKSTPASPIEVVTRHEAEKAVGAGAANDDWKETEWACNATDFRVVKNNTLLLIDLAATFPIGAFSRGASDLTFVGSEASSVSVYTTHDGRTFTALANGARINPAYIQHPDGVLDEKDCLWPEHAGVVQITLTPDDQKRIAARDRVAIQVYPPPSPKDKYPEPKMMVLLENEGGWYVNVDRASVRMEPKGSMEVPLYVYRWGLPQKSVPLGLSLERRVRNSDKGCSEDTEDFLLNGPTPAKTVGAFILTISTTSGAKAPQESREPMDSQLYFIDSSGSKPSLVVGQDNWMSPDDPTVPLFSFLFWQNKRVKANPTWSEDIGPILAGYARLYPGMKEVLDISNLEVVMAYADALRGHFRMSDQKAGYMPVVHDMSPGTVDMIVSWLDQFAPAKADDGQGGKP